MTTQLKSLLGRIASANREPESGTGLAANHLVPVFVIVNQSLAKSLELELKSQAIQVRTRRKRLNTEFFVRVSELRAAADIRDRMLATQPDTTDRRMSRDYDSLFLFFPFVMVAALVTYLSPVVSNYIWVGVLASGMSIVFVVERLSRQYRYQIGWRFGVRELLWGTLLVAVNVIVWNRVL